MKRLFIGIVFVSLLFVRCSIINLKPVETVRYPGSFGYLSPLNGASEVPINGLLAWDPSEYASKYYVFIDTQPPSSSKRERSLYATSYCFRQLSLQPATTYYWYVVAENERGTRIGGNTAYLSFTTKQAPVTVPVPSGFSTIYPENDSVNHDISVYLAWEESEGAVGYEVFWGKTEEMAYTLDAGSERCVALSGLEYDSVYHWSVYAYNEHGRTGANHGLSNTFRTKERVGEPPSDFSKSYPMFRQEGVPKSVELSWTNSPGATHYLLYLSTSVDLSQRTEFTVNTNSLQLTDAFESETRYYWQVVARNDWGEKISDSGNAYWFVTESDVPGPIPAPEPFQMLAPSQGAVGTLLNTSLTWEESEGALAYDVYLQESLPLENPVARVSGTVFMPSALLKYSTRYFWNVKALNGGGETWSAGIPGMFTTESKPETPTLPGEFGYVYPFKDQTSVPRVMELIWEESARAGKYKVYFGTEPQPPFLAEVSLCSFNPGVLEANTVYYWYVEALNAYGSTVIKDGISSFTTTGFAPTAIPEVAGTWTLKADITGIVNKAYSCEIEITQNESELTTRLPIEGLVIDCQGTINSEGVIWFSGRQPGGSISGEFLGRLADVNDPVAIENGTLKLYYGVLAVGSGTWEAEKK